jgi:WD40 repeat protein
MARLFRRAALALMLPALLAAGPAHGQAIPPGYHDQPVLVVDPGRHTARISGADVNVAKGLVATASYDRTVRVWSLATGALERTFRLPAGAGNTGKAYSVAIDRAGELIAVAGWLSPRQPHAIYLVALADGSIRRMTVDPPGGALSVAFSPDGEHLVATLDRGGIRIFGRAAGWAEVGRDTAFAGASYRAAFAADGRLVVSGLDGHLRLYDRTFQRRALARAPGGRHPMRAAFSPDGRQVAVGYADTSSVDVLDGETLAPLHEADTRGIGNSSLAAVAWLSDGTLVAAGSVSSANDINPVVVWPDSAREADRLLMASLDTVTAILPLPDRALLVAASDPWLARLSADGERSWVVGSPLADFRGQFQTLGVSHDGRVVAFGYDGPDGIQHARFDVAALSLAVTIADSRLVGGGTTPPVQEGLRIGPLHQLGLDLNGRPLPLLSYEVARSLAIHPDGARFVVGADWSLRAFQADGTPIWPAFVPGTVWATNISGDGRLVVAAYADGTIRWHRMDDGREILALMPLADRRNWVAWTPEGFYAASPGAHGLLRWHVNRPGYQQADSFAVADIPGFHRPAVIPLVLQELETARAIGIATIAEQRRKVQLAARSQLPPGAKLHLLAVGVSRYNDRHGAHLRLNFAQQDAHDVASALAGTQDALYVPGTRQYLPNDDATRPGILRALDALRAAMGPHDLAVVHFAGHGAMVDGELFLLPHDVDARDAVAIRATALPIAELKREILKVSERGRVLVLLDACYSGAASADGRATTVDSVRLTQALAAANVTVLTSSSADQASREDAAWSNGAFTEAFLEALGTGADDNHDGLISATELASYVDRRVRALTGGRQSPAMEVRFGGTLFAVR